jgi:outer membrane protein OmpA-like peptidoglycan-associated protein
MKKQVVLSLLIFIGFRVYSQNDSALAEINKFRQILNGYSAPIGVEKGKTVTLQRATYDSLLAVLENQQQLIDQAAKSLEKANKQIREFQKASLAGLDQGVIYFEKGSYLLTAEAKASIKAFVLQNGKDKHFAIDGFTDQTGSKKENDRLSKLRALEVQKFLLSELRIPSSLVTTSFFGSEKQVCETEDPACQQRNRRVEIRFKQ